MKRILICLLTLTFFFSCRNEPDKGKKDALFSLLDSKQTGIDFANQLTDGPDANIFLYRNFYNGGGVAIGDINNDGLNDIFLTANQGDNKLYINKGNWQFEDITEKSGVKGNRYWSTGVTMADVNADGWLDIYVCNSGSLKGMSRENELYINQKNGTFVEMAATYGLADNGLSTHAVFLDYDLDGDLDCYVLNNSFRSIESFDFNKDLRHTIDSLGGDRLYRNDNMHFTNVTTEAGIYSSEIGFGLGVSITDINNDGYPDIYVSNDFFEKDYLYINQKNGTFKEGLESAVGHMSLSSMGGDIGDINNDGNYDIFTTEMLPEDDKRYKMITSFESYDLFEIKKKEGYYKQYMQNCLQVNNGDGSFSELSHYAGIDATDWSWGALVFDMDNDGWKDIFVSNGIYKDLTNQDYIDFLSTEDNLRRMTNNGAFDYKEFVDKMSSTPVSNYAFSNNRNLTFSNRSADFGLNTPSFSNGAAYGDLDNDGDNDLVVNNVNMPVFIYRNNAEKLGNHYLRLKLKGDSLNQFSIGSTIKVFTGATALTYYHHAGHGFQSSTAPNIVTIGVGKYSNADSVAIIWPNGNYSLYKGLATDTLYSFNYTDNIGKYDFAKKGTPSAWTDVSPDIFDSVPVHTEDDFIDYDQERLMLQTATTANPFMAAADINNDGLTDFYYGSSKGKPAQLYIQSANGKFKQYIPEDFKKQVNTDNAGAVFGDFDKDGDPDLIVTHGGNEEKEGSTDLLPTFYKNDGKGNFTIDKDRPIAAAINASVIRADDFDKDGDLDLFIGGRIIPGNYGSSPSSFLFQNDGTGHFTDISSALFGNDTKIGMITDAKWADIDGNGFDDLVLAGQWMGILIYKNDKGTFTKEVLGKYQGWWSSLEVADVNGDGKPDIIGGNLGLNSKFKASFYEPMHLYIKDFDDNGMKEPILSLFKSDHKQYVFHQRRDLAEQLPSFKKKFLKYADYAGKEFIDVFPASATEGAEIHEINFLETALFINNGNLAFDYQPFPFPAQTSCVNAILCEDIDGDGRKEIILTGNFTDFKPEVGALDASYGQVYEYINGSLKYKPTGLKINGQVRSSLLIRNRKGASYLLFGRNNDQLAAYRLN